MEMPKRVATWRKVLAPVLDFLMILSIGWFVLSTLTGGVDPDGYKLETIPAIVLAVVIIAYFWLGSRYAGGTLWQRILGTRRS
jgi:hypothetical protein